MSRTREAPTPTNTSMNSVPAAEKNGTSASPAMAFASSVLPARRPRTGASRLPRRQRAMLNCNQAYQQKLSLLISEMVLSQSAWECRLSAGPAAHK